MLNRESRAREWFSDEKERLDASDIDAPSEEIEMPEAPVEDLPDSAIAPLEQNPSARIATGYGGHAAEEALGNQREIAQKVETKKLEEADMERSARAGGEARVRAKLEAGADKDELLASVEGQLEELDYEIDEFEESGQDTLLKEAYLRRSDLDAQRTALLNAGAISEKSTPEVQAGQRVA